MQLTRGHVRDWLTGYERAWRTAGTAPLRALFSEGAVYRMSPYEDPIEGLAAIERMWEAEREGPNEEFSMTSEVIAVDGSIAVVRVEVIYGDPAAQEYRDLWLIEFAADGRCTSYEEWPFFPGQPYSARSA